MLADINRRYKFGLFLTLVAVGLCLLFDASLKQTAGALILGFSTALILGGLSVRTLQFIGTLVVLASGMAVVGVTVSDWRDATEGRGHDYDNAILDLKVAIPNAEWSNDRPITSAQPDAQVSAFAAMIRAKYPGAYDDLSDDDLARKTLAKYPQYSDLLPPGYGRVTLDLSKSQPIKGLPNGAIVRPLKPARKQQDQWEIVKSERIVELPASAKKWERRFPVADVSVTNDFIVDEKNTLPVGATGDMQRDEAGQFVVLSKVPFPSDKSGSEIMQYFQTKILRPRPVFSLRAALHAEIRPVSIGLALFVAGAFGCIWLAWTRPRRAEK
jgi:hypothetical protein